VNQKAAARVAAGHPWIFASDVVDRGGASPGDVVEVVTGRGRWLGVAHYSSTSQICLRLLSSRPVGVDADFFVSRIRAAEQHRRRVVSGSNAYRVVYSEADFLPGLVVDRYADYLVLQCLSQGMDRATPLIVEALRSAFNPPGILARNDVPVRDKESLPRHVTVLDGEVPDVTVISMNGLTLEVELKTGQKTGVFLDQRENYMAAARYARGAALDCFTCTGGFALHMARACSRVTAVDSSAPALAMAQRNAARNGVENVEFLEANVFDLLNSFCLADRHFDAIVLDPPAFAKSRSSLDAAARGYKEINFRAMKLLSAGGTLVSCSCSHHMSEASLLEVIATAALDAGRTVRILERRTQAQDHPILLTAPETLYLKCLILEVL
jgi:23S rRNA (cytosine1962-C5)-methyltransferase